jgi:hypothetical protein
VIIRPETAADHDAIRKVNDEAFGGPLEAKLVDAIRASDRFLPELSLVAALRLYPRRRRRHRATSQGARPAVLHDPAARAV